MTLDIDQVLSEHRRQHINMYFRVVASVAAVNTAVLINAASTASIVLHLSCFLVLLSLIGKLIANERLVGLVYEIGDTSLGDDEQIDNELTTDELRTSQNITVRILLSVAFLFAGLLVPALEGRLFGIKVDYIWISGLIGLFVLVANSFRLNDQLAKKWQMRVNAAYKSEIADGNRE